jgi:hypothetical protein
MSLLFTNREENKMNQGAAPRRMRVKDNLRALRYSLQSLVEDLQPFSTIEAMERFGKHVSSLLVVVDDAIKYQDIVVKENAQ